jgi:hypothetical protein
VPNALRFSVAVGDAPRVDGAAEYGRDIKRTQQLRGAEAAHRIHRSAASEGPSYAQARGVASA